jgi:hypothetical protein
MEVWGEILFNLAYLAVVWALVATMIAKYPQLPSGKRRLARLFIWAFALLGLGDTGHVGFRVLAYGLGNLETTFEVLGVEVGLVGMGVFSTSLTVTLFYMVLLMIWRERYGREYGWAGGMLFGAGVIRIGMMLFAQNEWDRIVSPQPWATYRNVPLVVLGLGTACLILRGAREKEDRAFKWIGVMVLVSYAFYVPVVLLVEALPMIGMLMIPKTVAYVAIAWLGYREIYQPVALGKARTPA